MAAFLNIPLETSDTKLEMAMDMRTGMCKGVVFVTLPHSKSNNVMWSNWQQVQHWKQEEGETWGFGFDVDAANDMIPGLGDFMWALGSGMGSSANMGGNQRNCGGPMVDQWGEEEEATGHSWHF